ncbi:MAG: MGMT family protein [Candidatus Lokiarchaeota archaeon]|nr:MGMT family protein [Candidatus Lokiarchaeota archaeon]
MDEIRKSKKWNELTNFQKQVLTITSKIPKGKVSTYGQIAEIIGNKYFSRAVGNALNKNPFAPLIPCHRVVKSNGDLGGFARGSSEKEKILIKENIIINNHKINLSKFLINKNNLKSE